MKSAIRSVASPADQPSPSEMEELRAVLLNDQRAWRRFVQRHDTALREVVRDIVEPITGRHAASEIDDVMGGLWLRMVDDDMRWLRAFNPAHGGTLLQWLTMHASQLAHDRVRELRRERMRTVSLDEARPMAGMTALPPASSRASLTIDHAIREAVRDVVREEIQVALRGLSGSVMAPNPTAPSEYLLVADACEIAKVHPATVRAWIREGRLRGHRAGRHHRIKRSELDAFLASLGAATDFDLEAKAKELAGR